MAGECPFTCCQEWKIAVDDDTFGKWKNIPVPKSVQSNPKKLNEFTTWKDGTRVIALNKEHQCPFFNREKLCELVLAYGDEMLSKTCGIFPREIHACEDRVEYTLMPSCPAVIDLLKGQETFLLEEKKDGPPGKAEVMTNVRAFFIDIMKRKEFSPEMGLLMIFYFALDMLEKESVTERELEDYRESGILSELQEIVENMEFDSLAAFEERNELLLDLMENYRREGMYAFYLDGIADLAERYSAECDPQTVTEKFQKFRPVWKRYEALFRNLLCEEIFAESVSPKEGAEHMVVRLQWIAMEYAAICQCLFLKWDQSGNLTYEDVRDYIVVLFRMTGYDEEDIYEYLENSFESLIWDWGYLALLVGKG